MTRHSHRHGFSVVELLIVLGVLLLACGYVVPAVLQARQAAESKQTINNLKEMALGMHSFHDVNKRLPPAFAPSGTLKAAAAVHVHLLPYVGQNPLFLMYLTKQGKNGTAESKVPPFLASEDPSDKDEKGVQNFAANLRAFSDKARRVRHNAKFDGLDGEHTCTVGILNGFPDGTSNSVIFGTKYRKCGEGGSRYAAEPSSKFAAFIGQHPATKPADPADGEATFQLKPAAKDCRISPLMPQSFSDKGLLIALADGSIRVVSPKMSAETWNRALHPSDGFPLGADWE